MRVMSSEALVLVAALAIPPAVWAADAESGPIAERLFRKGQAEMKAGQIHEACADLAASLQLDRAIGTLLNLATCHEKEGKTASAWNEFSEAVASASKAGQNERAAFARKRVEALESKLLYVTISVPQAVPGLEVKLSGKVLPRAAWETELPVDPGDHTIEATAPDRLPFSKSLQVSRATGNQQVTIPMLEKLNAQTSDPATAAAPRVEPAQQVLSVTEPSPTPRRHTTAAIVGFSAGAAAVASGVVCTVMAKNRYDSLEHGTAAPSEATRIRDSGKRLQIASVVLYGVGAAALATGAVLWFTGSSKSSPPMKVAIAPSQGGGMLVLSGVLP